MLTVLLIVLAPMALVVLPLSYGIPVAVFTVLVLAYQEWLAGLGHQQKADQKIGQDALEAVISERIAPIARERGGPRVASQDDN